MKSIGIDIKVNFNVGIASLILDRKKYKWREKKNVKNIDRSNTHNHTRARTQTPNSETEAWYPPPL